VEALAVQPTCAGSTHWNTVVAEDADTELAQTGTLKHGELRRRCFRLHCLAGAFHTLCAPCTTDGYHCPCCCRHTRSNRCILPHDSRREQPPHPHHQGIIKRVSLHCLHCFVLFLHPTRTRWSRCCRCHQSPRHEDSCQTPRLAATQRGRHRQQPGPCQQH